MADDKKVGGILSDKEAAERITFLLGGLFLLSAISLALLAYLESLGISFNSSGSFWTQIVEYFINNIWPVWIVISAFISALAIAGIVHNLWKLHLINLEEQAIYYPTSHTVHVGKDKSEQNKKWKKVLEYMNSDNPSDWRASIIEADVMLEELLQTMGLHGDSVGEMLKSADRNEFRTLNEAWEAHKIRNDITHTGSGFQLNERETKRAIALFEKVFQEFRII